MDGYFLTPFEVSGLISSINHKKLSVVYPEVEFDVVQQKLLINFLLMTGEVRQAIKISTPICVVAEHIFCSQAIDEMSVKYLPVGYYLTDSKLMEGVGAHTYLEALDGAKYTVVSERLQTHRCSDTGRFFSARKVDTLRLNQRSFHELLLYREDVERYLAKLCSKDNTMRLERPLKVELKKHRKVTLEDLMEATGTSCAEDAYDVAIWHIEQTELHNEYLEKSFELSVLHNMVRKCITKEFFIETRASLEAYLQEEYQFTTRQAHVFAEQIIKVSGK